MTTTVELGAQIAQKALAHYGVKGMKWGVRKDGGATPVKTTEKPGRRVKAKGGQGHPPHEDAVSAARSRQVARRSTTDALSTQELRNLVNRMQLEDQYASIMKNESRMSVGKMMAKNLIREFDADLVTETATEVAGALGKHLSPKAQAKIHFGTGLARVMFGVKSAQLKKPKQKQKQTNE